MGIGSVLILCEKLDWKFDDVTELGIERCKERIDRSRGESPLAPAGKERSTE